MNRSNIVGIVIGLAAATAIGAIASYSVINDEEQAEPTAATSTAARNCYEVQVERPAEPGDDKKIAGTAIGALIGGAVGRDVGDSDLTTAAGAAAGAYAGRRAQDHYQENNTETATEVRCE